MNVVSYAQMAFKKLIFQARPARAHAEVQRAYDSRFKICICHVHYYTENVTSSEMQVRSAPRAVQLIWNTNTRKYIEIKVWKYKTMQFKME